MPIYRGPGGSGDATADSSSEATLVAQLVVQAETSEANAASSATSAASSASAASSSASSAASSASTASTAATNAQTAETNAETAEANAETAEANAETAQAAAEAAQLAAETAETNAETAATNAASSASSASTSATNASNSASSASTSATNASNSASAAATSATNAANSATSASGSATSAASSASSASTSASNAATSETNAAASASTATTQAGIATTQASNAATSASNAASSASSASTSASNASTSASNAATSETNAANSATAAAASYDSFDDRYLGAKSSAPTVDNDGNALLVGALYFNTASNFMKVWDGSSWLDAYASLSGALLAANNLSDLTNIATARTNLGVAIGTNVQAWDADLDTWATKTAPSGTVVGTSDSQTLTNKTLALGSNTVSGTLAEFNTAVTDADFASLAGSETLSNKTLAGVTNTGNLAFTGTGNRITGDFSNATVANRVIFQTSTTNGNTNISAIPNGTATRSNLILYNSADPANAAFLQLQIQDSTSVNINSVATGTGTFLPLTFQTGGSERLRIDTSGNVGIGTSSPAMKLDVNGIAGWQGGTTGQTAQVVGANSGVNGGGNFRVLSNTTQAADVGGSITLGGYFIGTSQSADFAQIIGAKANSTSNDAGGYLSLLTRPSGGNMTERMRIDSSGNVGIGTSSPAQKLQIGLTGSNNYIQFGTTNEGYVIGRENTTGDFLFNATQASPYNVFKWQQGGTERMRITSSGDVGIGTGSFSGRLAINGGTGTSQTRFEVNTTEVQEVATNAAQNAYANRLADAAQHIWKISGSERMRITSSGDVGIGTSSPTYPLTVGNNKQIGGLNTSGSGVTFAIVNGSNNLVFGDDSVNTNTLTVQSRGNMSFQVNTTERGRFDTSGNFLFNSGYGSVATAYGCRAWVNFNGTGTVAIRGSGNVSSITDNGTGNYTVNFTTAMPDANYSSVYTSSYFQYISGASTNTTTSSRIETVNTSATNTDRDIVCAAFFR